MNDDVSATKRIYEQVLELRNFEIKELVQRNNFFMIFQGVLLASALQSSHSNLYFSFIIFLSGATVSYLQMKVAAGAKFWQEHWEIKLRETEKKLLGLLEEKNQQNLDFGDDFEKRNNFYQLFQKMTPKEELTIKLNLNGKYKLSNHLIMTKPSVSRMPIFVSLCLMITWIALSITCICVILANNKITITTFPIITEIIFKN